MAAITTPVVGQRCAFYLNTGTVASPTWDEITAIGDLAITGFGMGMAELKRRGNNWTKNIATLMKNFAVEGNIIAHMDTATYALLKTKLIAGTPNEYAVMNGPIATSGMLGLRVPLLIEDFPTDQAQEKVVDHAVKFVPAYFESPAGTEVDPSFYEIT